MTVIARRVASVPRRTSGPSRRRSSVRADVLDWWQAVLDETKEFVDDRIDQVRGHGDSQWKDEVAALREVVAELTAKVDGMETGRGGRTSKPPSP